MKLLILLAILGLAPQDDIDIRSAVIERSAQDVASWPITTTITRLEVGALDCGVEFDKKGVWPDVPIPGWNGGAIQYTLWLVRRVGDQVYTGGGIEFWKGRVGGCGPASGYIKNWYYDGSWGPLNTAGELTPGEQVGFFVTAGDARAKDVRTITERSNVVTIPWPGGSGGVFSFTPPLPPPVVVPPPPIIVPPPTPPIVVPPLPVIPVVVPPVVVPDNQLGRIETMLKEHVKSTEAFQAEVKRNWKKFTATILKYGGAVAAGILAKWGIDKP